MSKIKDVLAVKGREVWSVGPAHSVYQAIEMMALRGIGALTVLSDTGDLVGIISERDYARKVILEGKSSQSTSVAEIMTRELISIDPHCSINDAMALMTNNRVRHLPVLEENCLVGVVSVGDLVKCIIDEQTVVIDHLERYIKGETA